jgi:hypothetical protein
VCECVHDVLLIAPQTYTLTSFQISTPPIDAVFLYRVRLCVRVCRVRVRAYTYLCVRVRGAKAVGGTMTSTRLF